MNHLVALSSILRRMTMALGLPVMLVAVLSWPTLPAGASSPSGAVALAGTAVVANSAVLRDPGGPGYPTVTPTPYPNPPYPTGPYVTPVANYPPAPPVPNSPSYVSPADCPTATPTPTYPGGPYPTPTPIGVTAQ